MPFILPLTGDQNLDICKYKDHFPSIPLNQNNKVIVLRGCLRRGSTVPKVQCRKWKQRQHKGCSHSWDFCHTLSNIYTQILVFLWIVMWEGIQGTTQQPLITGKFILQVVYITYTKNFKELIYFSCSNFPELHFINCVLFVHGQNRTC